MKAIRSVQKKVLSGMTLVELMIVIGIIALLTTIALPSIIRARRRSTSTAVANDYRKAGAAFEQYAISHGDYPADTGPGVLPGGMQQYMPRMNWSARTPIGGQWDWDGPQSGFSEFRAAVSIYLPTAPLSTLLEIDRILDDGDIDTGEFVRRNNGYAYILEH